MLSLQTNPLSESLKQQVMAINRDTDNQGCVGNRTSLPDGSVLVKEEEMGQVEYYVDYCVDRYAMTYKTQVLYPEYSLTQYSRIFLL